MKKYLILVLLICCKSIIAQQLPVVSYFMYDYARTNPGSLGSLDMVCATMIWKSEFSGMPGQPEATYGNVDIPFKLFGAKHGVGINFYTDEIGFYKDLDIKLGYAYRVSIGEGSLGIGISGGFKQRGFDEKTVWEGNGSYDPNSDPYIPEPDAKANVFNFGAGIFYRTDEIYFGASAMNIVSQEMDYAESGTSSTTGGGTLAKEKSIPHYFMTAGYMLPLSNAAYEFQPSVSLYSDGISVTFDLNGTLTYNKKLWAGVSYRAGSGIIGMAGLSILDGLKVGYAYDFHTSALSKQTKGSHEILLNYNFKLGVEKSPQRYKSIRYL